MDMCKLKIGYESRINITYLRVELIQLKVRYREMTSKVSMLKFAEGVVIGWITFKESGGGLVFVVGGPNAGWLHVVSVEEKVQR